MTNPAAAKNVVAYHVNCIDDLKCIHQLPGAYLWRGQSNSEWPLDSAAYRREKLTNPKVMEGDIVSYETQLLEDATHRGYRVCNGRELADLELLALLQHSGAATRLLDTTRSALVGLWFACAEHDTLDGCLFGIASHAVFGHHRLVRSENYERATSFSDNVDTPHTIRPPNVSLRVAAQHSQFIYSAVCENEHGTLAIGADCQLVKIQVFRGLKTEILRLLDRVYDINRSTLFPDLDGFGRVNAVDQVPSHLPWKKTFAGRP